MGHIYKITNKINNMAYIGQTIYSIENRWKEHLQISSDSTRRSFSAVHKAIQKYGKENFIIEEIEECDNNLLNEREIYWINYYNTYENGYNLTRGGAGTKKINYQEVIKRYLDSNLSCTQIAKEMNISTHTVGQILKAFEIPTRLSFGDGTECAKKVTSQYTKKGEYIQSFSSEQEAAKYISDNGYSKASLATIGGHIGEVCSGKWKTAYGFKWSH